MVRRKGELPSTVRENMGGGEAKGNIELFHLLDNERNELLGKGRLFSRIVVKPGDIIGYHRHKGEMECYYILEGQGEYNDNGNILTLGPGDVSITSDGESHGIKNTGGKDLVFVALILFT